MKQALILGALILVVPLAGCSSTSGGSDGGDVVAPTDVPAADVGQDSTTTAPDATDATTPGVDVALTDAQPAGDGGAGSGSLFDRGLRACALSAACASDPAAASSSTALCAPLVAVLGLEQTFATDFTAVQARHVLQCADAATDCTSFGRCLAGSGFDATYCAAHSGRTCSGTSVVDCTNAVAGYPGVTDCAAVGMTCQAANGSAACTDGHTCAADASTTIGAGRCDGQTEVTCDSATHLEQSVDCTHATPASVCLVTGTSSVACVPDTLPTCTGTGTIRCEGDSLVECVSGREISVDCTQLDNRCVTTAGGDGSSTASCQQITGTACTGSGVSCSGTHLVLCANGNAHEFDCAAAGFRTCVTVMPDGTSPSAYCAM